MNHLVILNHPPYDGSDIAWNALRLVKALSVRNDTVVLFLMNDAVDLARDSCTRPDAYDNDLVAMVKDLIEHGVEVKVCGTCMARCGVHRNEPYYKGSQTSTMNELASLVVSSDRVLTF